MTLPQRTRLSPAPTTFRWSPRTDGITYSLLCGFLECPRRFGIRVIDGWEEDEGYRHALEYGNFWHIAEEFAAKKGADWREPCRAYYNRMVSQYPTQDKDVNKSYYCLLAQFPHYQRYWAEHKTEQHRVPILEEYAFNVIYPVFNDFVTLRGKFDCVFAIPRKDGGRDIWLQENKTKGEIDERGISQTLHANLQTNIYSNALITLIQHAELPFLYGDRFAGTIYNVVRRPLSGMPPWGPRRKAGENDRSYYDRVSADIAKRGSDYFMRWETALTLADIAKCTQTSLLPILVRLLFWYERRTGSKTSLLPGRLLDALDYQTPWGIWSPLANGWTGSYFGLLTKNSKVGLRRVTTLFPELELSA